MSHGVFFDLSCRRVARRPHWCDHTRLQLLWLDLGRRLLGPSPLSDVLLSSICRFHFVRLCPGQRRQISTLRAYACPCRGFPCGVESSLRLENSYSTAADSETCGGYCVACGSI
eukprot:5026403-Heterocapsa_arctica.AAC.1